MDGSSTALGVTLSGDQNEVFKYLVLQSLLSTASFRKSNGKRFFLTSDFYGLIIVYTLEKAEISP